MNTKEGRVDLWSKQIDRRQMLKALGVAGSALAFGNVPGLAEFVAPGSSETSATAGEIPQRALGKTGVSVSTLCFGGAHWGRIESDAEAIRVMHEAIDAGITFLDNAWEYNGGRSERLKGKTRQGRPHKPLSMTQYFSP